MVDLGSMNFVCGEGNWGCEQSSNAVILGVGVGEFESVFIQQTDPLDQPVEGRCASLTHSHTAGTSLYTMPLCSINPCLAQTRAAWHSARRKGCLVVVSP
jgi:hypothetical protein